MSRISASRHEPFEQYSRYGNTEEVVLLAGESRKHLIQSMQLVNDTRHTLNETRQFLNEARQFLGETQELDEARAASLQRFDIPTMDIRYRKIMKKFDQLISAQTEDVTMTNTQCQEILERVDRLLEIQDDAHEQHMIKVDLQHQEIIRKFEQHAAETNAQHQEILEMFKEQTYDQEVAYMQNSSKRTIQYQAVSKGLKDLALQVENIRLQQPPSPVLSISEKQEKTPVMNIFQAFISLFGL